MSTEAEQPDLEEEEDDGEETALEVIILPDESDRMTGEDLIEVDDAHSMAFERSPDVTEESAVPESEENVSQSSVFKLPPEVMLRIFSYFPVHELCLNIAPVCRHWYRLAHTPSMWRHICLARTSSLDSALNVLGQIFYATVLNIVNQPNIQTILFCSDVVARNAKTLTCLDLGFNELSLPILNSTFSADLPRLQHLNLEGCSQLDLEAFKEIMPHLTDRLRRLSLSYCTKICDDALKAITSNFPHLTHINLDGCEWVSDDGVRTLVQNVGASLEALWLDGENITDQTIELIPNCANLSLFSMRYCESLTNITPLKVMSSLRSLTLRKCKTVRDHLVADLFNYEDSKLAHLRYLDMSECPAINDDILSNICRLCGPELCFLMLEWCWEVSDAGLQVMVHACPLLERLALNGMYNLIGRPFGAIPDVLPRLAVLNLTNCGRVCDELMQEIVDKNPALIIFNYYGDRFETDGASFPEVTHEHHMCRYPVKSYGRLCNCINT